MNNTHNDPTALLPWPPRKNIIRVGLSGIINTHTHPRDTLAENDGRADMFVPLLADTYDDVIAIGNTSPALTSPVLAIKKKRQWQSLVPAGKKLRIHVAGLMTEATTPEMVVAGYDQPSDMQAFKCMKMFVRAASNASGADVDDMRRVVPVLKAMSNTNWKYQRKPMVLKVHCERKYTLQGGRISIFDRERVAVERDINYLLSEVPEATIEICHVSDGSTIEAIRHFRSKGFRVHGEIAPHYTQYTIDDLFEGADGGTQLNAHRFCLPVFKSDKDRQILLDAMVSGDPAFHFGDDEACHVDVEHIYANPPKGTPARGYKISKGGYVLGGQTQIPEAVVSYVIEQFADRGQLDHLPDFMSGNARKLYDLPEAQEMTYWHPEAWIVPHVMSADLEGTGRQLARMLSCKVAMGGQTRHYRPLL